MSGTDQEPVELAPSEVRQRILDEHVGIRTMLDTVERLTARLEEGQLDVVATLRSEAQRLLDTMLVHIDLEDRILAPALRETDAFGPLRADRLVEGHVKQRDWLHENLDALSRDVDAPKKLAKTLHTLVAEVRADMEHEEAELLNPELLRDDPINVSFTG